MIRVNLARLLGEKDLTRAQVEREAGIDQNTLGKLFHQDARGLRFDTLDRLCKYLNVPVGSILEYKSGKRDAQLEEARQHREARRIRRKGAVVVLDEEQQKRKQKAGQSARSSRKRGS